MGKLFYSQDVYFGKLESKVREQVGKELDDFKQFLVKIENKLTVRIMNVDFTRPRRGRFLTVEELQNCDSKYRCKTVAAFLYNDSFWRLEIAHLMICIGLFSIAYSNLRTALEDLLTAFIVERQDEEAQRFLSNKKVELRIAERLINPQYNEILKAMKEAYSGWGVHTRFESIQLTSLFGGNRFDKYTNEVMKKGKTITLPKEFADAARHCLEHARQVSILFSWLESMPIK